MADAPEESVYRAELVAALGIPFTDGNDVEVLTKGKQIFPAMLAAISGATQRINFLTFVYWTGDIAEAFAAALSSKARDGVPVRVLLDAYGSNRMPGDLAQRMLDAGVDLRRFRPLRGRRIWRNDKRSHRKILVVDDTVAFTGGVGIAAQWEGDAEGPESWRETHLKVHGPALAGLNAAFLDNWNETAGHTWDPVFPRPCSGRVAAQVISSSTTIAETTAATLISSLVAAARREVLLASPYVVLTSELTGLLLDAMRRGVTVKIMFPTTHHDSRLSLIAGFPALRRLRSAGATLLGYEKTMLHCKVFIVDRLVSCVGSPNLNRRSFGKDEECALTLVDAGIAARLVEDFEHDVQACRELTEADLRPRTPADRARHLLGRVLIEQL